LKFKKGIKMKKLIILISMFAFIGCATTTTKPPVGCEDSKIYANKQVIDTALTIAVTGIHAMAIVQPQYYTMAHEAAQKAAALLQSKPISLDGLIDNKLMDFFIPLLGLIPINSILSECDRTYLANNLLRI
jgi:hypothetical protein